MTPDTHTKPEESKSARLSVVAASIVTVLAPGAYLLGLSFYQGYLSAFGVGPEGFPISTPDVYVFSYQTVGYFLLMLGEASVTALEKILSPPLVYWIPATLILLVGGIYLLLRSGRTGHNPHIQQALPKVKAVASWLHWKNNDFIKSVGIVFVPSYSVLLLGTFTIAIALFWWTLPLEAYSRGQNVAQERIGKFLERGCHAESDTKWNTCFVLLDDKGVIVHEGLLITMNDKEMAFFKKDGSYIFPRKEGTILRRTLH